MVKPPNSSVLEYKKKKFCLAPVYLCQAITEAKKMHFWKNRDCFKFFEKRNKMYLFVGLLSTLLRFVLDTKVDKKSVTA